MTLPRPLEPFLRLAASLRANRFAVASDQTIAFIEGVGALGPRDIADVYRAARALFAIPIERAGEFDAIFRAVFLGQSVPDALPALPQDEVAAHEPTGGDRDAEAPEAESPSGAEASLSERLSARDLAAGDPARTLADFVRAAPAQLPRRRSYRYAPARRGARLDMRRTLREAARRDGEVVRLVSARRRTRQRRIVLLIDVSGSMKERTETMMRFAHALVRAADRVEVFTLGTRLTRVTAPLAVRDPALALDRAGRLVADLDGGTRIGAALEALLAVPRYAGFARGAAVIALSDGLEREAPEAMAAAVTRLSRLAWRLVWLSPLADGPGWRPETRALAAAAPAIDAFGPAADLEAVCGAVLDLARAA